MRVQSAAIQLTGKKWRLMKKMENLLLRILKCWNGLEIIHTWNLSWKQDAPTRSGYTWQKSGILFWEIRFTEAVTVHLSICRDRHYMQEP